MISFSLAEAKFILIELKAAFLPRGRFSPDQAKQNALVPQVLNVNVHYGTSSVCQQGVHRLVSA